MENGIEWKIHSIFQVTFVEAVDQLMPGFDPEIGKLAQRILINPRKIDWHTGVLAKKVQFPLWFFSVDILSSMAA